VVILDLTLPNESGWDLLPDLHAQQPDTRVVVLTGGEMS
jgi:DNA-binding NarL/FixJ family response regulator